MRFAPLALLLAAAPAFGQALSPEALTRIKGTTCYIKVRVTGGMTTGSGFLVRKDEKTAWIATNNHVIAPTTGKRGDGEPMQVLGIEVVFLSGTPQEWRAAGVVVARDPLRDLASVRFTIPKGVTLPAPVSLPGVKASETMPVYVCGFPFGEMLSEGSKNPEISIGPASVSSVRTDDRGDVHRVQINGALNPGNSGGPIVDSTGKLVGVAVTTIVGAGLGQAVPQHHVKEMMDGRVSEPVFARTGNGVMSIAYVVDPLNKLKIGKGWIAPVAADNKQTVPSVSGLKGAKDYTFTPAPGGQNRGIYFADLPGVGVAEAWTQSSWTDADGTTFKSKPRRMPVRGAIGVPGGRPGNGPPPTDDDPPSELPPEFYGGIPGLPNPPTPPNPGGPFAGRPDAPLGPRRPNGPRGPKGDGNPGGGQPQGEPAFPPSAPRGQPLEADTAERSNELLDKLAANPGGWVGRKFSLWLTVTGVNGNRLAASRPDGRPLTGLRVELNPQLAETVKGEHARHGGGALKGIVSFRVARVENREAVAEGLGVVLDPGVTGGGPAAAGGDAGKPPIEEEEAPAGPKTVMPARPNPAPAEMSPPPESPRPAAADDEPDSGKVLIIGGVLMAVAVLAVGGIGAAVWYTNQPKPKKKSKKRPRDWDDEDDDEYEERPRRRR